MGTCYLLTEDGNHLVQEQGSPPHALLIDNCVHNPVTVGGLRPGRRFRWEELEEDLRKQRPFTRQLYEELLAAQERAQERVRELEAQEKYEEAEALEEACEVASEVAVQAIYYEQDKLIAQVTNALNVAAKAKSTWKQIEQALFRARLVQEAIEEEEAIILLLWT